eukprot:m.51382 g.51382  ORF g.51382 m.51382 type:complete len:479 (-) comp11686_c0_seq2:18-1454(-)
MAKNDRTVVVHPGSLFGEPLLKPRGKGRHPARGFANALPTSNRSVENPEQPHIFKGVLVGHCVQVIDSQDVSWLYKQGFFGKGFYSKSEPILDRLLQADKWGANRLSSKERGEAKKNMRDEKKRKRGPNGDQNRKRTAAPPAPSAAAAAAHAIVEARLGAATGAAEECVVDETREGAGEDTVVGLGEGDVVLDRRESLHVTRPALVTATSTLVTQLSSRDVRFYEAATVEDVTQGLSVAPAYMHDSSAPGPDSENVHDRDGGERKDKLYERARKEDKKEGEEGEEKARSTPTLGVTGGELREHLQLSLEEAFFLTHALGCMHLTDEDGEDLTLDDQWQRFAALQPDFAYSYTVYLHLRSAGWVPKSGIKYGSTFMAYRKGPSFFHASFSIVIRAVDATTLALLPGQPPLTWAEVTSLGRLCAQVAKELVTCYVLVPPDCDLGQLSCLHTLAVKQVLLRRWQPERARSLNESTDGQLGQ